MIGITQTVIFFSLLTVLVWIVYRNRASQDLKQILVGIPVMGVLGLIAWGWSSLRKVSPVFSDGLVASGLQYFLGAMLAVLSIAIIVSAINWIKHGKLSEGDYFFWSAGGFFVYAWIEAVPSVLFALTAKITEVTGLLSPIAPGTARFVAFSAAGGLQVLLAAALYRSLEPDDEMSGSISAFWWILALLVSPVVIYGLVHQAVALR